MRPILPASAVYRLREIRTALADFFADDALTLGAALAFYSALSLAPLLLVMLWASSYLGPAGQAQLTGQIVDLFGAQAGEAVRLILESAESNDQATGAAGIVSAITLLISAAAVFGQLQHAMNIIWGVTAKPSQGVLGFLRKRFISLGMVMAVGFLLIVSLAVSTVISFAADSWVRAAPAVVLQIINAAVPVGVFWALFGMIFKILPDVQISWRDVWSGALITAILFTVGKALIGLYLGRSNVGLAYGTAGSLIVLLVWVYYSSLILFFGAELTQVRARAQGRQISPNRFAELKAV